MKFSLKYIAWQMLNRLIRIQRDDILRGREDIFIMLTFTTVLISLFGRYCITALLSHTLFGLHATLMIYRALQNWTLELYGVIS